uniref:NOP2/Sun RNA methyltransferase family member 7 n=1 Tax=Propithecus coquereli TaxID=379532 RepID=A0A2K6EJN2_PROCO
MRNSASELQFSSHENAERAPPASLAAPGDAAPSEKSSPGASEKPGYADSVYVMAANIFQGIRIEKSPEKVLIKYGSEPLLSFAESEDESFRRSSYELAFSALKYQDILETILIDSYIFPSTTIFKTKLAAALARCRIKHDALSIYHILPETVRKQELRASTLPLYAWMNTCKISPEEVYNSLKKRGYNEVKSVLHIDDKVFAVDQHCYDVLIFPSHLKNDLIKINLFKDYKLIFQDKSRSLAVHSVKALLNMDDDILMVNTGSWYTVAHMSTLTNDNTSKIFVCGVQSQAKDPDLRSLFKKMGCKNTDLLKDLSQGGTSEDKLHGLAQQQYEQLIHAMKFTKAQAVVYCTCSVYPEENEAVVKKALEFQDLGNKVQPYSGTHLRQSL